eukprot:TRINITY_DN55107_c0_g1_i1.p1 TRINITY_DN55107_c0_g1~~TRINITY_DN55107_c0_g1_i1.p1  ORF type:complete len:1118 (+),score=347.23 TRINITY_DN55107_c0_g1_i1:96-3356(+)
MPGRQSKAPTTPNPNGTPGRRGSAESPGGAAALPFNLHRAPSYLRVRPYLAEERAAMQQSGLDDTRSGLECDAVEDVIKLLDVSDLAVKAPSRAGPPKRRVWSPSGFDGMLWSFGEDPWKQEGRAKPFADDIDHIYCDQQAVCEMVSEGMVAGIYRGEHQAVVAYGGPGSGKSYTIFGNESGSDPGLAPRLLDAVWRGRLAAEQAEGEELTVHMSVVLLRVFMEQVEDVTQACLAQSSSPRRMQSGRGQALQQQSVRKHKRGETGWLGYDTGVMDGAKKVDVRADGALPREMLEPLMIHSDEDLERAKQACLRLGARKERRAHAVVLIRVRQVSHFAHEGGSESEVDDDDGEYYDDLRQGGAAQAGRWAQLTLVDVGAGKKAADERDDRGHLPKSRFELSQCVRALKDKSQVEDEYEEQMQLYRGNTKEGGAKAGRVQYNASRLTCLLQEVLGGNCRTAFVCCCAPSLSVRQDTVETIEFGRTVRGIRCRVRQNQQQALQKLRQKMQEKSDMVRAIHQESENVMLVQQELRERRLRIEGLEAEKRRVDGRCRDLEEMLADEMQFHKQNSQDLRVMQKLRSEEPAHLVRLGTELDKLRQRRMSAEQGVASWRAGTEATRGRGALLVEMSVHAAALAYDIGELLLLGQHSRGDTVEVMRSNRTWTAVTVADCPGEETPKRIELGAAVARGDRLCAQQQRRGTVLAVRDAGETLLVRWWDAGTSDGGAEEEVSVGDVFALPLPQGESGIHDLPPSAEYKLSGRDQGGALEKPVPLSEEGRHLRRWEPRCRRERCGSLLCQRAARGRDAARGSDQGLHLPECLAEYMQEVSAARRALCDPDGLAQYPFRPSLSGVQRVMDVSLHREIGELAKRFGGGGRNAFERIGEGASELPSSAKSAQEAEEEASALKGKATAAAAWPPPLPLRRWLLTLSSDLLEAGLEMREASSSSSLSQRHSQLGTFSPTAPARDVARWRECLGVASAVASAARLRLEAVADVEEIRFWAESAACELRGLMLSAAAAAQPCVALREEIARRQQLQADIDRMQQEKTRAAEGAQSAKRELTTLSEQRKIRQSVLDKASKKGGCVVM